MKYLSSITALAAFGLLVATSCSKETNNYNEDDRTPIRLSSNVELGTLRLQDTQIAEGQSLSFFVTEKDNAESVIYDNQRIIADGDGGFAYGNPMYYPLNGSSVDFYAVHPSSDDATMESEFDFDITANQSQASGYLKSDLLYAIRGNVAPTATAVTLTFYHKLAKLDFVIIKGDGDIDISALSEVTVMNSLPTIGIDLTDGSLGNATGSATEIISYGVDNPNTGTAGRLSGITAIVVPQTITGRIFRINIGGIDYYYTSTEGLKFEEGKKYKLELTINQAGITLKSTIEDWTDGGTIIGDGSSIE